ncbi:hypothetical protein [Paludibacterium denitrificans]|uniref:Uncharacterized protein n=1 Tax=Paludibacterium denitrificans TaxID=2675226 RepID=A0A844GB60_9NEIS|nr:hypothetical protein [Paludibacterium denitrificans]MTD32869.1 hypothetical protein [Paludibacterium denitrificans]
MGQFSHEITSLHMSSDARDCMSIRTMRIDPLPIKARSILNAESRRLRVAVLSGDDIDGACMRLRLHDVFSLLTPWVETIYFPGNTIYGMPNEAVDIDKFAVWADIFVVQAGCIE